MTDEEEDLYRLFYRLWLEMQLQRWGMAKVRVSEDCCRTVLCMLTIKDEDSEPNWNVDEMRKSAKEAAQDRFIATHNRRIYDDIHRNR